MNLIAVDASSSTSGVSLFVNNELVKVDHFKANKKDDLGKRLYDWGRFLHSFRAKLPLDLVALEREHVMRNMNSVRMICYYESVVMCKAGEWNVPVKQYAASTARKIALGNGNIKKDEIYDILLKRGYKLSEYKNGGNDESDSIVIGEAAIKENG